MLYFAIDQYAKQITVCIRNEEGETRWRHASTARSARSVIAGKMPRVWRRSVGSHP